jgi:hypothetical protein
MDLSSTALGGSLSQGLMVYTYAYYLTMTFVFLFAVFVMKIIIAEISYYVNLTKFKTQKGAASEYIPFLGIVRLGIKWDGKDKGRNFDDLFARHADASVLAINIPGVHLFGALYMLLSPKAKQDFIDNEIAISIKNWDTMTRFPLLDLGFLSKSGPYYMKIRGLFSEFFLYDRIQNLKKPMLQILNEQLLVTAQSQAIQLNSKPTSCNIRGFLSPIMINWIASV